MIDLHADTIYKLVCENSSDSLDHNDFSVDAEKMKRGGVKAQCFALFTPVKDSAPSDGLTDWQRLNLLHSRFEDEIKRSRMLKKATSAADIRNNELGAILTIEDMTPIEGIAERLAEVCSWDIMISSITWNYENAYGYPNSKDKKIMSKGLKEKGFEALEVFKEKKIAVDVSHLSDGGFWDVIASGCKVLATHSNCRALVDVSRNLTDEMLRALCDRGGVAGLNFCPAFLYDCSAVTDRSQVESRIEDMVRHVMHMYKTAGEDVLALGTDFDGISGKLEIPDSGNLNKLFDALKAAGLSERVLDKMRYQNALRVLS